MPARLAPLPVQRFTTDAYALHERHEAWVQRDWPAIGSIFATQPLEPFHNRSDRFSLGAIGIHVADMGAQHYERDLSRARRDGFDQLIVTLMLSGSAAGDADGVSVTATAGVATFTDLTMRHVHESSSSRTILLTVPRAVAHAEGLNVRALHGATASAGAATLLRNHLINIHAALPELSVRAAVRLERSVVDLLCLTAESAGLVETAGLGSREAGALLTARRLITMQLGSSELDADWLCARLQVSRTTLYRLFQGLGGVAGFIRDQRLDRIADMLTNADPALSIAEIGERWGLGNASHLSRAFRERFGMPPGAYRAAAADRQKASRR